MPAPTLTPEQRAAALEAAKQARNARAAIRKDLASGAIGIDEVVESSDPVAKKTRVLYALESLPGIGKTRALQLMEKLGIPENRKIGGLGDKQRKELIDAVKAR